MINNSIPNYGPWHEGKDATPEELLKMYPKSSWGTEEEKAHMAILYYSPPFCPIDEGLQKIWDALLSAGFVEVRLMEQDGKLGFTVSRDQTITLKKGEFYPIKKCGGMTQQKVVANL